MLNANNPNANNKQEILDDLDNLVSLHIRTKKTSSTIGRKDFRVKNKIVIGDDWLNDWVCLNDVSYIVEE